VELDAASLLLSEMAVVRVDSAFEEYFKTTSDTFCAWLDFCGKPIPEHKKESEPDLNKEHEQKVRLPVIKEIDRFGWYNISIQPFEPVLGYFSLLRNCIVHRNGRPSNALLELANCEELQKSLDAWPKRKGVKLIDLPALSSGMLQVLPRHPIFYSEACHRLGKLIDKQFVNTLGFDGMVWMAARSAILRAEALAIADVNSRPEAYLSTYLSRRCLVTVNGSKLIPILRNLGLWTEVRDRFNSLAAKRKAGSAKTAGRH
jgi:hypothetical protein